MLILGNYFHHDNTPNSVTEMLKIFRLIYSL